MPEKARALYRGKTDPNGAPLEWLGPEPGTPAVEISDGTIVREATQDEPGVPAHHLNDEEYDALSTRNKQRVREAKNGNGEPLYEVRSVKEMSAPASTAAAKANDGEGT
ncbi:MAG TPA: hypothetical protein VNM48_08450 [Chloroflexota bacterium]|nr:hypothetical protein [Chloroflexota bacterium]